jgi:hypothetical protein
MAKINNIVVILHRVRLGKMGHAIREKILTVIVGVFDFAVLLYTVYNLTTDMFQWLTFVDFRKSNVWRNPLVSSKRDI